MKNKLFSRVLLLCSSLVCFSQAQAATAKTTLDVTALVGTACSVSTTPVAFIVVDQAVDTYASGGITVTCRAGTNFTIALDAGQNYNPTTLMRSASDGLGNLVDYDLGSYFYGQPWGDDGVTIPNPTISEAATGGTDVFSVDGILWGGQFKPGGVYNDIVNVSVSY